MPQQESPCPICVYWIYQPSLIIDYKQTAKNAKALNHDGCLDICKHELEKLPKKKFKLLPSPNTIHKWTNERNKKY